MPEQISCVKEANNIAPIHSDLEVDSGSPLPEPVSHCAPEPVPHSEKQVDILPTETTSIQASSGLSKRVLIATVVIIVIILGAVIGGAVGGTVGKSSSSANTTSHSTSPSPWPGSNGTIYENTSLAATTLPNGDRRVYFQDASGLVREAQYEALTKTWDASKDFVVTNQALNGTALAVDNGNVTTSANETTLRIGLVLATTVSGMPVPSLFMRDRSDTPWENIRGVSDEEVNNFGCASETRFGFIMAQNTSNANLDLTLPPYSNTWMTIFYQPAINTSDTTPNIVYWTDLDSIPSYFGQGIHPGLSLNGYEPGRGFGVSVSPSNDTMPHVEMIVPTLESIEKSALNQSGFSFLGYNLWTSAQDFDPFLYGSSLDVSDILLDADIVYIRVDDGARRVFWLNSDMTLHSTIDASGDSNLAILGLHLPFPKFAATAARSENASNQDIFLYYQENGTHLAEISYRDGYWNATPTFISIP